MSEDLCSSLYHILLYRLIRIVRNLRLNKANKLNKALFFMNDLLLVYNGQKNYIKVSRTAEYLERDIFPIEQHHTVSFSFIAAYFPEA